MCTLLGLRKGGGHTAEYTRERWPLARDGTPEQRTVMGCGHLDRFFFSSLVIASGSSEEKMGVERRQGVGQPQKVGERGALRKSWTCY